MAKRKKKAHSSTTRRAPARRKAATRRRKRGISDGKLTGNPYIDAAAGIAATLLAKVMLNKLPIEDIKKKTGKGLDDPMMKKLIAGGIGIAAGYFLKNKAMMMGAGSAAAVMVVTEKFRLELSDGPGGSSIQYVDADLLNDSPTMYLSDNEGNQYGINDDGQIMNLADGAIGYTVFSD